MRQGSISYKNAKGTDLVGPKKGDFTCSELAVFLGKIWRDLFTKL